LLRARSGRSRVGKINTNARIRAPAGFFLFANWPGTHPAHQRRAAPSAHSHEHGREVSVGGSMEPHFALSSERCSSFQRAWGRPIDSKVLKPSPDHLTDPAPDGSFHLGSLRKLRGLGPCKTSERCESRWSDGYEQAPPRSRSQAGSAISTAKTRSGRDGAGKKAMGLELPWTIMLDHRLPEFRAVDLIVLERPSYFGAWLGN
jgi:hypothetical protein